MEVIPTDRSKRAVGDQCNGRKEALETVLGKSGEKGTAASNGPVLTAQSKRFRGQGTEQLKPRKRQDS